MKQFVITNKDIKNGVEAIGDYKETENYILFFDGTLYDDLVLNDEIANQLLTSPEEILCNLKGEFLICCYDKTNEAIFVATDRMGKENCYYIINDSYFMFSTNFWLGLNYIKPNLDSIDFQSVKEIIVHNRAFLHNTIVQNYKIIAPGTYISSKDLKVFESKNYWRIIFNENRNLKLENVVDSIENYFDETFKFLSDKYPNKKFGLGLSGGLDSRILAKYAKKYQLELVPFCIGKKYSFFPLKTWGYYLSHKIAKLFNLRNFKFIDFYSGNFLTKLINDVLYIPNINSNIEISQLESVPDFDIMLNGEHGGVFFGEFDFEPLLYYDKSNLSDYMLSFLCWTKGKENIITESESSEVTKKINDYISSLNSNDRHNLFYTFFFEIYGSKSRGAFFETLYNTKNRYTPFLNPDFFDFFLTWDQKFLIDRVLQKKLFEKYFKDLSKIPDETVEAPLYYRKYRIKKLIYEIVLGLKVKILKPSLNRDEWIHKSLKGNKAVKLILKENQKLIDEYFPNFNFEDFLKKNPRGTMTFLKLIVEIDVISNESYSNLSEYIYGKYGK